MSTTYGIRSLANGEVVAKFTFEATDMKARAKVYALTHEHGVGLVQLFKLKDGEFEFVGEGAGIDTPANPNVFRTPDCSRGYDSKGRFTTVGLGRHIGFWTVPSWY